MDDDFETLLQDAEMEYELFKDVPIEEESIEIIKKPTKVAKQSTNKINNEKKIQQKKKKNSFLLNFGAKKRTTAIPKLETKGIENSTANVVNSLKNNISNKSSSGGWLSKLANIQSKKAEKLNLKQFQYNSNNSNNLEKKRKLNQIDNSNIMTRSHKKSKADTQALQAKVEANKKLFSSSTSTTFTSNNDNTTIEFFSKIRIISRTISQEELKARMNDRIFIGIDELTTEKTNFISSSRGGWSTIATIVSQSPIKTSSKGSKYRAFSLSNLKPIAGKEVQYYTSSLMLFGDAFTSHYSLQVGDVIALWSPSISGSTSTSTSTSSSISQKKNTYFQSKSNSNNDKNKSKVSLSINKPSQLSRLGKSQDLAVCKSLTKSGTSCSNWVNKSDCEYCQFHLFTGLKQAQRARPSLSGSTNILPQLESWNKQQKKLQATATKIRALSGSLTSTNCINEFKSKLSSWSSADKPSLEEEEIASREPKLSITNTLALTTTNEESPYAQFLQKQQTAKNVQEPKPISINSVENQARIKVLKAALATKEQKFLQKNKTTKASKLSNNNNTDMAAKRAEFEKKLAAQKAEIRSKEAEAEAQRKRSLLGRYTYERQQEIEAKKRVQAEQSAVIASKFASKFGSRFDSTLFTQTQSIEQTKAKRKQLAAKKSKYAHLAEQERTEAQNSYFSTLEEKDKLVSKMESIYEETVKLWGCVNCGRQTENFVKECKDKGHSIIRKHAVKRWWSCKRCSARTNTYSSKYTPVKPCWKCGNESYIQVGKYKSQSASLAHDQLVTSDPGQKFLK